jgi:demethylphylloquinone reductase
MFLPQPSLSSTDCHRRPACPASAYDSRARRTCTTAVLRPRIAVVGGGFGGLTSALKLASMPWTRLTRPQITLVDRSDRFSFLPMMYELATGEAEAWEVAPRFETLLADSSISFLHGSASSMTLNDSPVLHVTPVNGDVSGGRHKDVPFDRAILALGCEPASREAVPGAAENALPLHGHDSAMALRERLGALRKQKSAGEVINVVVVGGGHSGVEAASCIAEMLGTAGSVLVVDRGDRLLANATDYNRVTAERAMLERGVGVEYRTAVASVSTDSISLGPARPGDVDARQPYTLPADLVVWTTGVRPSAAIASLGVPVDEANGRVAVDSMLQVRGHEGVLFALGDGATMPVTDRNGGYAGTAQVAAQQAEYAAWNTWASLTGRQKLEYRYMHLGEMLVLGARDASVASPLGVEVEGAAAWAMRRAAYLARMPTDRHRAKLAVNWAVAPALSEVASQVRKASESSGGVCR